MKALILTSSLLLLMGCQSMPEPAKDNGQAAAQKAKDRSDEAYRDLSKEME